MTDEANKTVYVVMKQGDDDRWQFVNNVTAATGDAAIREAGKEAGTYVAVPSRSFHPRTVTVQTQLVTKLS